MEPQFFKTPEDFRKWFAKNHDKEKEVIVGFYKKGSGKPSMDWSESVDQALCYGWIDGVRKSIDADSYCIRFTPRKPTSIWSTINIKKIEELTKKGLMKPAGIAAFEKRTEARSGIYSFENEAKTLAPLYEKQFMSDKKAWAFFSAQPPGYKRLNIFRVMSAKQEKTQLSRLKKLIAASKAEKRID
ncbi:MAG TPA: YdeI/OmpD-associated family protein [Flavobacterium sp.]|nr:YdeI/OmpD-associated family protein [Flavobacterium sp.]